MMNLLNNIVKMGEGKSLVDTIAMGLDMVEFTEFKLNVWTLDDGNVVSDGVFGIVDMTNADGAETGGEPVSVVFEIAVKTADEYNAQVVFDMDVSADSQIIGVRLSGDAAGDAAKSGGKFELLAGTLDEVGGVVDAAQAEMSMAFTYDATETSGSADFTMLADTVTLTANCAMPEFVMDGDRLAKLDMQVSAAVTDSADDSSNTAFAFGIAYDQSAIPGPMALDVTLSAQYMGETTNIALGYSADVTSGETCDNYMGHVKLSADTSDVNGSIEFDLNITGEAITDEDILATEAGEDMINFAEITPEDMETLQTEATGWMMILMGEFMSNPGVQAITGSMFGDGMEDGMDDYMDELADDYVAS